ncbi:hypothetical protein ACWD6L_02845 [Micromonospora profundi]|uniref:Uncharacterized protein n=1 Tax=Micromonospora profundi TaxID=1420889 RepID=A0AAJ6HR44_9ACTN|nr:MULTISPECIES: hypothetical protein [Micromonospora]NJC12857.1 hypothetical protein [Micromonospora profundi]WLS44702.1 hypothetical protein Q3V37_25465 [Micromonospora profundi]
MPERPAARDGSASEHEPPLDLSREPHDSARDDSDADGADGHESHDPYQPL